MIKLYENFTDIKDIKQIIFLKAVDTCDIKIIEFFLKKGYDINIEDALAHAIGDYDVFRYFLKNGADVKENLDYHLKRRFESDIELQKILIDFGYDVLIHDEIGFLDGLKRFPKYADVVKRFEDVGKYNL